MATARPRRARATGSARSTERLERAAHANGQIDTPAPAPAGPQIEPRYEWVAIDAKNYPGFEVRLWTNHPFQLWKDVYNGGGSNGQRNPDVSIAALTRIVPEHNHWRDYDGREYSPADTPAFWDELPVELFRVVLYAIDEGPSILPNALRATRLASASSSTRTSSPGARPA